MHSDFLSLVHIQASYIDYSLSGLPKTGPRDVFGEKKHRSYQSVVS